MTENELEKVQYKACLAITGTIRGTLRQKFKKSYAEFGKYIYLQKKKRIKGNV